jgi:hypothetical protein
VTRRLQELNLVVVAGPHRLSVSRGASRRTVRSEVNLPAA